MVAHQFLLACIARPPRHIHARSAAVDPTPRVFTPRMRRRAPWSDHDRRPITSGSRSVAPQPLQESLACSLRAGVVITSRYGRIEWCAIVNDIARVVRRVGGNGTRIDEALDASSQRDLGQYARRWISPTTSSASAYLRTWRGDRPPRCLPRTVAQRIRHRRGSLGTNQPQPSNCRATARAIARQHANSMTALEERSARAGAQ